MHGYFSIWRQKGGVKYVIFKSLVQSGLFALFGRTRPGPVLKLSGIKRTGPGPPRTGPKTFQNQKDWTRTSPDWSFEIGAFFWVIM